MNERAGFAADGADREIRLAVDIRSAGYEAGKPVIRDVRFTVAAGELVGLIGPNGAGKSTTIKAVLGLLARTDGDIRFGGEPGRRAEGAGPFGESGETGGSGGQDEAGRTGEFGESGLSGEAGRTGASGPSGRTGCYAYVPEQPVFYEYFTLWEHLRLAASAFGIAEESFAPRAERLLERFRLLDHRHELPARFSKGMQQKMMLAVGFMLEPDLYIVDEPFIGLDPHATRDLLDLLEEERRRGAGILMSTHVLDTAERICTGFVLMDGGTVVARGGLDDVRRQAGLGGGAPLFDCFLELTKR
jgi:ABC-2 type transport system ATP-binding protein